jgi:hypothetical protein
MSDRVDDERRRTRQCARLVDGMVVQALLPGD